MLRAVVVGHLRDVDLALPRLEEPVGVVPAELRDAPEHVLRHFRLGHEVHAALLEAADVVVPVERRGVAALDRVLRPGVTLRLDGRKVIPVGARPVERLQLRHRRRLLQRPVHRLTVTPGAVGHLLDRDPPRRHLPATAGQHVLGRADIARHDAHDLVEVQVRPEFGFGRDAEMLPQPLAHFGSHPQVQRDAVRFAAPPGRQNSFAWGHRASAAGGRPRPRTSQTPFARVAQPECRRPGQVLTGQQASSRPGATAVLPALRQRLESRDDPPAPSLGPNLAS